MTLVVDASVAAKWLVPEPDTPLAYRVRTASECVAPDLVVAELANIAWKLRRRAAISDARFDAIRDMIVDLMDELHPLPPLMPRAIEIARDLDHPVYDCFYLALAERERAPLVTADKRLIGRVAGTPWAASVVDLASYGP